MNDCVSRQDAIKAVDRHTKEDGTLDDDISCILEELPPVTPTRPKGRWIKRWYDSGEKEFHMIVCSECQEEFSYDAETGISMDNYNTCPNCMADMREGEE